MNNNATEADLAWAEAQFEAINPTREDVRAFDESEDGARYLAITGMTMATNLGIQVATTVVDGSQPS
jgi:hypothetical protein